MIHSQNTMAKIAGYKEREDRAAERRGSERAQQPTALVAAKLDETQRAVRLRFRNGTELAVPVAAIAEIAHAPLVKLRTVVASPIGDGLIFDDADVAIYVPGLPRTSSVKRSSSSVVGCASIAGRCA